MTTVVVREYARLTTDQVPTTLDQATISEPAFEWLSNFAARVANGGASLLQLENRRWLRLDNYVGVVQTPCGTLIEILPKHTDATGNNAAIESRALLVKMLTTALDLPVRTAEMADITMFRHPLLEWVMQQFVAGLDHLIKRGLRFDYQQTDEEQRFMRGQLDFVKQMRQPPGRAHIFNIRHDLFVPDRPENRLLKSALDRVCKLTQHPGTWRLSHTLAGLLADIPGSRHIEDDFRRWSDVRLMAHYRHVRPWCELVLGQHMPLAVRGTTPGISLLFPMEKLFERYVEAKLRPGIPAGYRLASQVRRHSLCTHMGKGLFQLRPDLVVTCGAGATLVMDTKWKRITSSDLQDKYGLSQADFYQMFAYGHKYLDGKGQMALIYPRTTGFMHALPPFMFSPGLALWVIPFDLDTDTMCWPLEWNGIPTHGNEAIQRDHVGKRSAVA